VALTLRRPVDAAQGRQHEAVVRPMTGHVTERMTQHHSHLEVGEKQRAVNAVLQRVAPTKVEDQVEGPTKKPPEVTLAAASNVSK
jgi:hypothetical protein